MPVRDRGRRLPGQQLRPRHASTRWSWPARSRSSCGTSRRTLEASPRSCCRAGSPTATTCGRASSPGSARSCARSPRSPADGGLVLGHLQRLPGPGRGRARAGRAAAQSRRCGSWAARSRIAAERLDTPFTHALAAAGRPLRMPVAHGEGCFFADDATLDALERDGQVLFRYVDAAGAAAEDDRRGQPERLAAGHRRAS